VKASLLSFSVERFYDVCESLHDGARFSDERGEFYAAEHLRIAQSEADDIGRCDGANTFGCNRDAQTGANEPQNCEPVSGFLHDVWTKAILLKYCERRGGSWEVDEWERKKKNLGA